jgi:hypothetical protein
MYVYWSSDGNVQNTTPSLESISWGARLGAKVARHQLQPLT